MKPSNPSARQRSDAQRNRERILDAAGQALAADPDTSLNAIAKRANVGAGTLYRHFPTREDLVLALYHHEVENLSATVEELLATQPPASALRTWILRLAELIRIKHGLGEALTTAGARDVIDATYTPVLGAIRRLLDAGEQAGELRPGLDENDVLLLMGCVWRVPAGAAGQAQADRLVDTVVDALPSQIDRILGSILTGEGAPGRIAPMDAPRDFDELERQVAEAVAEQHYDVVAGLLAAGARRMLSAGWQPHRKADLAKVLKARDQFRYARQLYSELAVDQAFSAEEREKYRQQYALCVYKDLELPASRRYDRALEILEQLGPEGDWTAESLGLAGAVHKRRWQAEAKLTALETAYSYYSRGFEKVGDPQRAYCGNNAAFVLDCLAFVDRSGAGDTRRRREQAREIRVRLVDGFKAGEFELDKWGTAILAEAQFGLGRYPEARQSMRGYVEMNPDGWERESTASQVAELARLLDVPLERGTDAAGAIGELLGPAGPLARRARLGKVGLALSGGGFRASLFHIGVLARLAERDALRGIEVLSCVSGGSIVGAFYYLRLRELLQREADEDIDATAYVTLVQGVADDFLRAVQRNPRVQLSGNVIDNWKMAVRRGYSRTDRIAGLFDKLLYATDEAKGEPARWRMDDLLITPKGAQTGFSPRYGNWERESKVPILVLNATALNTGHSWQFTASWMGEPPDILDEHIDANPRLRRTYYGELPPPYRDEPPLLATAVAASACVPGLFPPIQLTDLYDGLTVELVDGGVHDNQGVASLIEQECSTVLVSDASGQIDEIKAPGRTLLGVAMRSQSVLSSRVRGAQLADLVARQRAGLLRRLTIIHLKKGLASEQRTPGTKAHPAVEPWTPAQDEVGDESGAGLKDYGIHETMQRALAAIRTDLDSFSDNEAYALMAAGYKMATHELDPALEDYPDPIQADWPFDAMRARLEQPLTSDSELAIELSVAKERFGKPFRRFWRRKSSGNGSFKRALRGSARVGAVGAAVVALPVWAIVAAPLSVIGAGGTRLYLATIGKVRKPSPPG